MCVTAQVDQIPHFVKMGQRPNLQAIPGPEHFNVFARTLIKKCWDQDPEQRPKFGGELHNLTPNLAPALFKGSFWGRTFRDPARHFNRRKLAG